MSLTMLASAAEIVVALSLLPILSSLGVDAGSEVDGLLAVFPPLGWLAVFAISAAIRSMLNWLSNVEQEKTSQSIAVQLQSQLYQALANTHWDTVRQISPPQITSALQSQVYEASYGFTYLIQVLSAVTLITGYLISSSIIFPTIFPALLAILTILWTFNARRNRKVNEISEGYVSAHTVLHQRYEDWVAISRISSLGVNVNDLATRFESDVNNAASLSIAYAKTSAATSVSYDVARVASIAIGVPIAWWLDAPPTLLAFGLVALVRVLPQASGIQTGYQGIVNCVPQLQSVQRLTAVLEADQVQQPSTSSKLEWKKLGIAGISIENTGSEANKRWILDSINLDMNSKTWLGITGPTGAGKTTLAEVLLMLVRPDSGEIRIDGAAVDDALAADWRNQAAYVPQDVVLLDATIRDNLRLYAPEATDTELIAVLGKAAGEFVTDTLPDGLDTRAGPGGRWLSGGERQRIGIARALLREPGFLVLDEPTAALDSATQARLMDSLAALEHKMSVVLITHRPELLRLVDRVISLSDGVATEESVNPATH